MEQRNFTGYIIFIMIIAGVGGILYGFDLAIVNGAILYIKKDIFMTTDQLSLMVASVFGGGAIATLISGSLADHFGRLRMMIFSAVVFIVGVILNVVAHNYSMLLAGRLIQGVAIGVISIICPLYLSEIMPAKIRGRGVDMFQLLVTVGILAANVVALYFAKDHGNWRGMFAAALVPGCVFFLCLWGLPASPRWLVMRHHFDKAKKVLARLHPGQDTESMLAAMKRDEINKSHMGSGIRQLFNRKFTKALLMVLAFACLNQLTGINSFLQYSALMLKEAGASSNVVGIVGSIWITLLNVVMTVIALSIIDRVGRKPLLSIGAAGVTLALIFMSILFFVMKASVLKADLFLGGLLFMIICFAIGPGAVIYLALSELLPTPIRSTGMSIALFLNAWVSSGLAAVILPWAKHIGFGGVFIITAIFTASYFYLAAFKMPETKGKTLEQIEAEFVKS